MKTYIVFAVDSLQQGQQVIAAVGKLGLTPVETAYTVGKTVEEPTGSTAVNGGEKVLDNDEVQAAPRLNTSPGEPSIGKIGSGTKEYLLNELKGGPRDIGYRDFHKYVEHLKLLWKRSEVKYDGKEYYL